MGAIEVTFLNVTIIAERYKKNVYGNFETRVFHTLLK